MIDFSMGLFRIPSFGFIANTPTAPAGGLGSVAGGSIANVSALEGVVNFLTTLNHPYGTCSTGAPDSDSFRKCWSHPVGPDFIPYMEGAPRGWSFAWCRGARGLIAPQGGCQAPCDCSTRDCVCAPTSAVLGLPDGTFVDGNGKNLGGAVKYAGALPLSTVKKLTKNAGVLSVALAGIVAVFFLPRIAR